MEKVNNWLPDFCYGLNAVNKEVILIKRGEKGYYRFQGGMHKGLDTMSEMNKELGVTPSQAEAMHVGSMFGWDVPGANPELYKDMEWFLHKDLNKIEAEIVVEAEKKHPGTMVNIVRKNRQWFVICADTNEEFYYRIQKPADEYVFEQVEMKDVLSGDDKQ